MFLVKLKRILFPSGGLKYPRYTTWDREANLSYQAKTLEVKIFFYGNQKPKTLIPF